ncbi:hypothetical protein [Metabacillus halosaccharovorans]|uniref:Uncharacterized protein n=1 Tax=Metabacillus halosaccharovorans TaxID=930124 RepID=A0ABT3DC84_9BACI|nr:hypothetical protein [Metabacillus halosaccharovorans]MCV9884476.1 hypothetical protein [Metabacillus halosaccharovorans]
MVNFIDLTIDNDRYGLKELKKLTNEDLFIIVAKMKLVSYKEEPFLSEEDEMSLEIFEYEREMDNIRRDERKNVYAEFDPFYDDNQETHLSCNKRGNIPTIITKEYCNPFDEFKINPYYKNIEIKSEGKYSNRMQGEVIDKINEELKDFLIKRTNFKAYLGQCESVEYKKSTEEIDKMIVDINTEHECVHSVKIQNWYYNNLTEYKEKIDKARQNEKYNCVEVYISNLSHEEVKAQIERNKSYDEIEENRKLKYKEIETYEVTEDKNRRTYTENDKYIDLAESYARELGKA